MRDRKENEKDFTLTDQYGKEHTLSDYEGKAVFVNFWATWCPPCRNELPDFQKIYEKYGKNTKDVIILGVYAPGKKGNEATKNTGVMNAGELENMIDRFSER